jgi:hypothetical protein
MRPIRHKAFVENFAAIHAANRCTGNQRSFGQGFLIKLSLQNCLSGSY